MTRLLLTVGLLLSYLCVTANHFSGAHLRYEKTDVANTYVVYLSLYKTCESGAIDLPTFTNIYVESPSNNKIINKNLTRISTDTLQTFCSGTTTSCDNVTIPYPGYIVGEYIDTVTLPYAATDWNFVFSNSNRNFGITNLSGASGQSFYIEAPLNNSLSDNNSAVVPDYPPNTLFVNDTLRVPLYGYDKDGDSVVFEFAQPVSGSGMPILYYPGYSLKDPFGTGGYCKIIDNKELALMAPNTGKYTLTLKVTEYRNKSPYTYTLRDFVIICINPSSGKAPSVPHPTSSTSLITFTCPGKPNSLNLNFIDPVPTDSVYITVTPPNFPGWTFNTSTTPGVGTGNANINWTTPPTLDPDTTPFFYIKVGVKDNGCTMIGKGTYVIKVLTRDCSVDSVWPGDANSDKVANLYDPLAIALAYNDTGATRPNASPNWQAQYCHYWSGSFLNNIDKKHADCNGDGKVDTADLRVITQNYSKIHAKPGHRTGNKTTGVPELYFDHSGIAPNPDSTVSIRILAGSSSSSFNNIYGLATNIKIDGLVLDSAAKINNNNSWLGNNTNSLSFVQELSYTSLDMAHARIDHNNTSGQGVIGDLVFTIPSNAADGQLVTLSFDKTYIIDKFGLDIQSFSTLQDTFYIRKPVNIEKIYTPVSNLSVYPNPGNKELTISFSTNDEQTVRIEMLDMTGRSISGSNEYLHSGNHKLKYNLGKLAPGMYLIKVTVPGKGFSENLRWTKY